MGVEAEVNLGCSSGASYFVLCILGIGSLIFLNLPIHLIALPASVSQSWDYSKHTTIPDIVYCALEDKLKSSCLQTKYFIH